jgi:hypothetical protein
MRNAIGFLIVLWGLNQFFGAALSQLNVTAVSALQAVNTAAIVAESKMVLP